MKQRSYHWPLDNESVDSELPMCGACAAELDKKTCPRCHDRFPAEQVKKRMFSTPVGDVESGEEICNNCHKNVRTLFSMMKKGTDV